MNSRSRKAHTTNVRAKLAAAALGAGVVVTMGALTVALSNNEAHATSPATNVGVTTVQTTPPPTPVVKIAAPTVTAKPWPGKDWPI
jgi:hypothetical protein